MTYKFLLMIRSKIQYIYYITVSAAWLASNKNLFLVLYNNGKEKIFFKDREDCLTRVC